MYKIDGQEYTTIKALAEAYNLAKSTVTRRLSKGATIEEAVKPVLVSRNTKPRKIIFNGEDYRSKSAFCKALGIKRTTLNLYLSNGIPFNEAVDALLEAAVSPKVKVTLGGLEYTTISSISRAYGLSPHMVNKLYKQDNLSEDSISATKKSKFVGHRAKPVQYNGKDFPSHKELAKSLGIDYRYFMNRLARGWSVDDIIRGM